LGLYSVKIKFIIKINLMKFIIFLFFLIFTSNSLGENISDFQIEGISVGDNLLDYFSKNEIKKNIIDYDYKSNKFIDIEIYNHKSFDIYDNMHFSIDPVTYLIYSVSGFNFYEEDEYYECYNQVDLIAKDLNNFFTNVFIDENFKDHETDRTGDSKVKEVNFWFDNDDLVTVECFNWSQKITEDLGWIDNLSVSIYSAEYVNWLNNEAY